MGRRFLFARPNTWLLDYVWLGFLQYALIFGVLLLVPRRGARTGLMRQVSSGVIAGAAAFCFLCAWSGLSGSAALLLAGGVGSRVATLSDTRRAALRHLVDRTVKPLAIGAAMVSILACAWYPAQERWAASRLSTPPPHAPNILLLVLDTVRASDLSTYGFERSTTPFLSTLAARGVRFDKATSTAPWTLASHFSILSGVFPNKMATPDIESRPSRVLSTDRPVLAEVLARRGYATAGFSANPSYVTRKWGMARGFSDFEDDPVGFGRIPAEYCARSQDRDQRDVAEAARVRQLPGPKERRSQYRAVDGCRRTQLSHGVLCR